MGLNEELTECLVLGHDLGHTPFGHSGERVMNELMKDHGGFEHNRQTLRILELLERRYPEFPGLNLTWEVREGIIKHRPDTDATAPAGVRAGRGADARGPARRLRGRDRLQQPRRGRRPELAACSRWRRSARSRSSARPTTTRSAAGLADERIARHHVVRFIIDRCARDLIETTPGEPRGGAGGLGGRRARRRAGGWWPTPRRWRRACAS